MHKTIHQFTTASAECAETIALLLKYPAARHLIKAFAALTSRKKRQTLLRLASYLAEGR